MKTLTPSLLRQALSLILLLAGATGLCTALTGCTDTVEDLYSREVKAYFYFSPVTAAFPLEAAVTSPGMWTTVEAVSERTYRFVSNDGRNSAQATSNPQNGSYSQPFECVMGFIVGTPSVPDLQMNFVPMAFDLACPTCFHGSPSKNHRLRFTGAGKEQVNCSFCGETFDLTQNGAGDQGNRLLRYPLTYSGATNAVFVRN